MSRTKHGLLKARPEKASGLGRWEVESPSGHVLTVDVDRVSECGSRFVTRYRGRHVHTVRSYGHRPLTPRQVRGEVCREALRAFVGGRLPRAAEAGLT